LHFHHHNNCDRLSWKNCSIRVHFIFDRVVYQEKGKEMKFHIDDAGIISYADGLERQEHWIKEVQSGAESGVLMLCEHTPVYTFGKSANRQHLLITDTMLEAIGAEKFETSRGGDITFHGPGQLVAYPILSLEKLGIGVKQYVFQLEQSMIDVCRAFNIEATRIDGLTGVWVLQDDKGPDRKIGAIGIRVQRGVTSHGFALNVNTDLSYFNHMIPCGIADKSVTSIAKETGYTWDMQDVKLLYESIFEDVFGRIS
jgi:lipoyl(octanoyl) transferase